LPPGLPVVVAIAGQFEGDLLAVLDRQVASFEAANPGIRIELVQAPRITTERHNRFAADLQAGNTSVDIFVLDYPWLTEFAAPGWLIPLDPYVELSGLDRATFLPAAVKASTIQGQLIALPWTTDGGVLYYRRDLLDKYDYAPPAAWPDLQRIALGIKATEGLPYGFVWQGAPYEGLTCNTLEFVWAFGGDVLEDTGQVVFDSSQTQIALQQMVDLLATDASPTQVLAFQENESLSAFRDGEAIFMRNWFYAWDRLNQVGSAVAGKVGIAPLPASCLGGQALGLSSSSLHKPEAFRFMAFLAGYDQQVQAALLAERPPALLAAFQDASLFTADPAWQNLGTALAVTRPRPQAIPYAELSRAIYTEVHQMLLGRRDLALTPAATAASVQSYIKFVLSR
jgi:trehalose/maltose transport system substrate-binding protein